MLAACCKPSSGAGVVWMEIPLKGWVQLPAMKNGDRLKVILLNSYYTRAHIKPEECKTEESLAQLSNVERKVAGLIPTDNKVFLAILCFETLR